MPHDFSPHDMLGSGGTMRRPRSEGHVLERNIEVLQQMLRHQPNNETLRNVVADLTQLHRQVSQGYHRNPYTPFRVVGLMGDDVHSVAYHHAKERGLFKHDFQRGSAQLYAVDRHGKRDLLITSVEGVPLWDEF